MTPYFEESDFEFHLAEFQKLKQGERKCQLNEDDFELLISFLTYSNRYEVQEIELAYQFALGFYPNSQNILYNKAEWLRSWNKNGQALSVVKQLLDADNREFEYIQLYADLLLETNQKEKAQLFLLQQLDTEPEDNRLKRNCLMLLTEFKIEEKNYGQALNFLMLAHLQEVSDEFSLLEFAFLAKKTKRFDECIEALIETVDKYPLYSEAWMSLGKVYYFAKRYDKAADALENSVVLDEKNEEAYGYLFRCYKKAKAYDKAIEVLHEFSQFANPLDGIYLSMGSCYADLKREKQARLYFRRAIRLNGGLHKAYYELGKSYFREDNWANAAKFFAAAFERKPKFVYCFYLAKALFKQEAYEEAALAFFKCVELDKTHQRSNELLLFCLYALGEYDKALAHIPVAKAYCKKPLVFDFIKSAIFYVNDHRTDALHLLESALEQDPMMAFVLEEIDAGLLEQTDILNSINRFLPIS